MTIADIKTTAEQKMARSIESFKNDLQKIRTGRAHPGILDQVQVDYYGSNVPISQVANVSLLDARTISVQPWEKGMGPKIEKAIRESGLGLNPAAQGDLLRIPMPALTEERRRDLQARLARVGFRVVPDGLWGPVTEGTLLALALEAQALGQRFDGSTREGAAALVAYIESPEFVEDFLAGR